MSETKTIKVKRVITANNNGAIIEIEGDEEHFYDLSVFNGNEDFEDEWEITQGSEFVVDVCPGRPHFLTIKGIK